MIIWFSYNTILAPSLFADLDLEECICGAVANITSTDHIYPSSHTRSLDHSYHRFGTLQRQYELITKIYYLNLGRGVDMYERNTIKHLLPTFSKAVMESCIDLTSFFKLSVLRATSTWSSELVLLKKSWAKSTRSSPAEKFFPEPVNSTTRQSLSEERSSKHCRISLQWEISHINK